MVTDPVCKMSFPAEKAAASWEYKGVTYYFCNVNCKVKFSQDPERYLQSDSPREACCCCAEAFEDDDRKIDRRLKLLLTGFILAAVMTVLTMLATHMPGGFPEKCSNYLQWLFASIAVFGAGGFLMVRGVKSLKKLKLNMFTLISMGIASAYFFSVYALFFADTLPDSLLDASGKVRLHFVPAAMITALVILGQYLEARASRGAGRAIRALMELVPPVARRIKKCCKTVSEVPLNEVEKGDWLKILPHDKIPVDGIVIEGQGTVDESMLTGEAVPVEKFIGSKLAAGTLNGENILVMQAEKVGSDTLLAQIVEMVKSARSTKLPVQKLSDRFSAVFVPAVLTVALIALFCWGVLGKDWSMALGSFIAVLLAACPCALGLAAPLAVTIGVGVGARNGILIKDPSALELIKKIDTIMLDKTGTLTENTLQVRAVCIDKSIDKNIFYRTLFALEQNSRHPRAKAILSMKEYARFTDEQLEVEDFTSLPGQGVRGIVDDILVLLGSREYMISEHVDIERFFIENNIQNTTFSDKSMIYLAANRRVWGVVAVGDIIRPEAAAVIEELRQNNIDIVIISGDNHEQVKLVADALNISEYYSALKVHDKLERVRARQAFGRFAAMVGDGVNDSAALAAADVSIAMGSGADAALENAQITLLAGNIGKLGKLFRLSSAVNGTIKLNLVLAFLYNALMIPLAAGAFYFLIKMPFTPVCSSIAMSGSCLLVVFNSLRLWKLDLGKQ